MIEIELSTAIVLYSSLIAGIVFAIWLYTELSVRRPQQYLGKQFLWKCDICGLSYLDEEATEMSQCPRCQSFITPDNKLAPDGAQAAAQEIAHEETEETSRRNASKGKRRGQRHRGGRRRR